MVLSIEMHDFNFEPCYTGTPLDFVGFLQRPIPATCCTEPPGDNSDDSQSKENNENDMNNELRSRCIGLKISPITCTADDVRQLVNVFQQSWTSPSHSLRRHSRPTILETMEELFLSFSNELDPLDWLDVEIVDPHLLPEISRLLTNLPLNITKLYLNTTRLDSFDATRLLRSLSALTHLTHLAITIQNPRDSVAQVIALDIIPQNRSLVKLQFLNFFDHKNTACSTLMRAALNGESCQIRELELPGLATELDVQAIDLLMMNNNHQLQTLKLSCNPIGDSGATLLASALLCNKTLIKLHLKGCDIGDEGCTSLGQALEVNQSLEVLDMSKNRFGDGGLCSLAEGLSRRPYYNKFRHDRVSRGGGSTCLRYLFVIECHSITGRGVRNLADIILRTMLTTKFVLRLFQKQQHLLYHRTAWALVEAVYDFNVDFTKTCQRLQSEGTGEAAVPQDNRDDSMAFATSVSLFRSFPLMAAECNRLPLIQTNAMYSLVRGCPSRVAKAFLPPSKESPMKQGSFIELISSMKHGTLNYNLTCVVATCVVTVCLVAIVCLWGHKTWLVGVAGSGMHVMLLLLLIHQVRKRFFLHTNSGSSSNNNNHRYCHNSFHHLDDYFYIEQQPGHDVAPNQAPTFFLDKNAPDDCLTCIVSLCWLVVMFVRNWIWLNKIALCVLSLLAEFGLIRIVQKGFFRRRMHKQQQKEESLRRNVVRSQVDPHHVKHDEDAVLQDLYDLRARRARSSNLRS